MPEVRLSPDLKLATVYIMPLGGADTDAVIEALNRHRRFIRGELAHAVNLKFAPDVRFRCDETFEEASRIDALLASAPVRKDGNRDEMTAALNGEQAPRPRPAGRVQEVCAFHAPSANKGM